MNAHEYMRLALKAKTFYKKAWLIHVFSKSVLPTIDHVDKPYPYQLAQSGNQFAFFDPEEINKGEDTLVNTPTLIDNVSVKGPLLNLKDVIEIDNTVCINVPAGQKIKTTYGRILFNLIALCESFGDKIPYVNEDKGIEDIEHTIALRLADNPEPNTPNDPKKIYVFEYLKFCDALTYLTGLSQLCVWAETPKLMLPPPGVDEYKAKLIAQYKDKLNDPAIQALIEEKLIQFDNEYLGNDPGAKYFANGKKMRQVVRKKLFLMYGSEAGIGETVAPPITNSLQQGWNAENFPQMNDSLRAGSYSRGFETQLGGELTKWLLRASTAIQVNPNDCGTKLGFRTLITDNNYKSFVKLYYLDESNRTHFIESDEDAKALVGKVVPIRSAMYCKQGGGDFCAYCLGERLSLNPTALSSNVSDFGSTILKESLAKMHGKALAVTPFRPRDLIT